VGVVPLVRSRPSADRRSIASPWFKRRFTAHITFAASVVFAAVCIAFGGVGIGVGVVVLVGVGVLVFFRRRKRWNELSRPPGAATGK
jgi:uncharacterized membrane protein